MTESKAERAERWHSYLYHDIEYKHAKALIDAKPLRVKERTRKNINSIRGKDFI